MIPRGLFLVDLGQDLALSKPVEAGKHKRNFSSQKPGRLLAAVKSLVELSTARLATGAADPRVPPAAVGRGVQVKAGRPA